VPLAILHLWRKKQAGYLSIATPNIGSAKGSDLLAADHNQYRQY